MRPDSNEYAEPEFDTAAEAAAARGAEPPVAVTGVTEPKVGVSIDRMAQTGTARLLVLLHI